MHALEQAQARPETGLAKALWHALLIAVATAEPTTRAPEALQRLVEPGFALGAQAQFYGWRYWQRLLRSLPDDERRAIVARWKTSASDAWQSCIPDELRNEI